MDTLAELRVAKADLEGMVEERTAALRQRDLLLREVYHRVKNNLQIIDGMVMMQARQLQDQAAKDSLQALRSRIYALGLVHQQLMASRDLQPFAIAPFLEELSGHIIEGGATENSEECRDGNEWGSPGRSGCGRSHEKKKKAKQ